MSFKSVLAWTLKSVCKEFSDLDLKYIEKNCIGDVSISNKAVHQDHPDRKGELVLETTDFNQKMTTDFNQYKCHRIQPISKMQ